MIISMLLLAQFGAPAVDPSKFPTAHCDKYQHVEHHPAYTGGLPCYPTHPTDLSFSCPAVVVYHEAQPDTCEENVLAITERDWQGILKRLNALEHPVPINTIR